MKSSIIVLLLASVVTPVSAEEPFTRFAYESPHMGTLFKIVLYDKDKPTADKASKAAFERVEQLNGILSDYKPDSEMMLVCKRFEKEIGEPVQVSDELFTLLAKAAEVSELSDGAFDATVGPLVKLWRSARKSGKLPPKADMEAARKRVGWKNVQLDPAKKTVKLLVPGMQLDFGGIAKGYASDEGLKVLKGFGIASAMVAASGDIAVTGAPPGEAGWPIAVGKLNRKSESRVLLLKDQAVSTSGDAEQVVEIDGVRYSHVLDPRTGLGLVGHRSVTVVAPIGLMADPLTKMVSVFEPARAVAALEKLPGVQCFIAVQEGKDEKTIETKGFAALLRKMP